MSWRPERRVWARTRSAASANCATSCPRTDCWYRDGTSAMARPERLLKDGDDGLPRGRGLIASTDGGFHAQQIAARCNLFQRNPFRVPIDLPGLFAAHCSVFEFITALEYFGARLRDEPHRHIDTPRLS